MPQIPVYTQQTVPRGTQAIPQQPDLTRDLAIAGASIQRATDAWARKLDADAAAFATTAFPEFRRAQEDALSNRALAEKNGAPDFAARFDKDFETAATELVKRAPNETARAYLQQKVGQYREEVFSRAKRFEAEEGLRHRTSLVDTGNSAAADYAGRFPDRTFELIAERYDAIDASMIGPEAAAEKKAEASASILFSAGAASAAQNPRGTLAALNDPNHPIFRAMDDTAKAAIAKAAEGAVVDGAANQIVAAYERSFAMGDQALAGLDAENLPPEMSYEVRSKVRERVNLLQEERRRQNIDALAGLERRIATGAAGDVEGEARRLYNLGAMSEAGYLEKVGQAARAREQAAAQGAEAAALRSLLTAGGTLDPKDPVARKFVDSTFAESSKGLPKGGEAWSALAADLSSRTGVVPGEVQSWLRVSALGGDPQVAAQSADWVSTVQAKNPLVLEYLDADTKSFALQVAGMVDAGADPQTAVETVRKNVYQTPPQQKEVYREQFNRALKEPSKALNGLMSSDDTFDPSVFSFSPDPPPAMAADFEALARQYFATSGGDMETAQRLAYADLKTRWGRSTVNGRPEAMRYAPEIFGIDPSRVRADLEQAYPGQQTRLIADALTERRGFRRDGTPLPVSWAIAAVDPQTGEIQIMPDRWALPSAAQLEGEVQAKRDAAVAAARVESERRRRIAEASDRAERIESRVGNLRQQ
jgi:hypothetical protein